MQGGKGDLRSQRQRRRDRYRGCRVCGARGAQCSECDLGEQLVAIHGYAELSLVVDGSFVESRHDDLGHGGAGLVLVSNARAEILASRACGFRASSSSEVYCCTKCGHTDHADINAAKVLLRRANRSVLPVEGELLEGTLRSRKVKVGLRVPRRRSLQSSGL